MNGRIARVYEIACAAARRARRPDEKSTTGLCEKVPSGRIAAGCRHPAVTAASPTVDFADRSPPGSAGRARREN